MKTLFIVLIIPLVSSNIWDNIFGNFDAPTVVIPSEFTVTFGISPEQSPYLLKIDYSTKFRAVYFELSWKQFPILPYTVIEQGYLNMTSWLLYTRRRNLKCTINKFPQIQEKLADVSGNPSTSKFLEPSTIFQLISFYSGVNEDGLVIYDMSSLLSSGNNKIYALFDQQTKLLKEIDLKIGKKSLKLYALTPLIQKQFKKEYFEVPLDWSCDSENQQTDFSNYTVEEIIEKLASKSAQEQIISDINKIIEDAGK